MSIFRSGCAEKRCNDACRPIVVEPAAVDEHTSRWAARPGRRTRDRHPGHTGAVASVDHAACPAGKRTARARAAAALRRAMQRGTPPLPLPGRPSIRADVEKDDVTGRHFGSVGVVRTEGRGRRETAVEIEAQANRPRGEVDQEGPRGASESGARRTSSGESGRTTKPRSGTRARLYSAGDIGDG